MALTQIYEAEAGHVITAARWNNEFGNIYVNGTDLSFPLTKAVSLAGWTLTLDAAGATTLVSTTAIGFIFNAGVKAGTPAVNGATANFTGMTFTDTATAAAGTASAFAHVSIRRPTLEAQNINVTTTNAASLYIENAPLASTNETITNSWAIWVDNGNVKLDGDLKVDGTINAISGIAGPVGDPYNLTNITLSVTMAANAVTVALKTNAGTNPSATDPVSVRFRNATLATSGTTNVNITSATSLVIPSGATLGTTNGFSRRIYIGLLNNAGTAELFVYNPLTTTLPISNLKGLVESALITTTTIDTSSDNGQVGYSTTGRSSVAFRIIGFFESTQATAGTWATAASTIQELQPWMPRTGHVIQTVTARDGASNGTRTSTIPLDDTLPQVGEGGAIINTAFTPVNTCNVIDIFANLAGLAVLGTSQTEALTVALFTDLSTSALVADTPIRSQDAVTVRGNAVLAYKTGIHGTLTDIAVRGGMHLADGGSDAWYNNSTTTATDLAASMNTYLTVTEIMA